MLLFGFLTYRRFQSFLSEHFPSFAQRASSHAGRPVQEILDGFRSGDRSPEELDWDLRKAIRDEDFEKAALLRDRIRRLKAAGSPSAEKNSG